MTLSLFGFLLALTAVLVLTMRQLLRSQRTEQPDREWLAGFNLVKYAPMRRLLDTREAQYLAGAGVPAGFVSQLRSERRRIFRVYLSNLTRDVARLHAAARAMVLASEDGAPELASRLAAARVNFALALLQIRFRLVLHACGVDGVDVSGVIAPAAQIMAGMRAAQPARQVVALQ